ncbi:hypothetical protein ACFQ4C_17890 [Larkinella insperata]|uniref:Uncharacterized protein n=1 Tax=Larkinella insperata TaxID=332158 RepID=A0ABW3Q5Z8_9BACT|nr:hypothetical protein [Larkinella insperata]
MNFNWAAQVVQFRAGSQIKAYSANQVERFTYLDRQANTIRKFATVSCPAKSGLRQPQIFEEVFQGTLPVYRKLTTSQGLIKFGNLSGFSSDAELVRDLNNYTYLVYFQDELVPLTAFYRQIWPSLRAVFKKEFTEYRINRATNVVGQLRLISRYNYLAEKPVSASLAEEQAQISVGGK